MWRADAYIVVSISTPYSETIHAPQQDYIPRLGYQGKNEI